MFEINVSKGKDNYSQRKSKFVHVQKGQLGSNKIDWTCVCNVHAIVQALLYSGWQVPADPKYTREPDAFANFIVQECLKDTNWFKAKMPALWNKWYEGSKNAYTPLELHEVLAHYVNEWLGCSKADEFRTDLSIRDIIKQLYENNLAIPTSVAWGGLAGHVITLVGFEATSESDLESYLYGYDNTKKAEDVIKSAIIDDPWGRLLEASNTYDGTQSGNDVKLSWSFFWNHLKDTGNRNRKFGHILAKPVTVV